MKEKKDLEKKIKKQVLTFQKKTGLKINYIDVLKDKCIGFNKNEDISINIKLRND